MKKIEEMTYAEMANELSALRIENRELKKYKHNSDREIFKYLTQEQKRDLFGFKPCSDTGKIVPTDNLDVMNNNFKKFYSAILKMLFPKMKAFKSTKNKYTLFYTTFNDMTEEQFSLVKEMIVFICGVMHEYKQKLTQIENKESDM